MLTLLKVEVIHQIGLTVTNVFYAIGTRAGKRLCRFIKTDTLKTAISTLLAMKGFRARVEDVRLDRAEGSVKIWTNQGIKQLPQQEVTTFLNHYNQLAQQGCSGECSCERKTQSYCIHQIAQHLQADKLMGLLTDPKDFISYWNISTKEAAVVFDVNAATVRRWLSGQRQPDKGYCLAAGIMNQMWQESGKPNILVDSAAKSAHFRKT